MEIALWRPELDLRRQLVDHLRALERAHRVPLGARGRAWVIRADLVRPRRGHPDSLPFFASPSAAKSTSRSALVRLTKRPSMRNQVASMRLPPRTLIRYSVPDTASMPTSVAPAANGRVD